MWEGSGIRVWEGSGIRVWEGGDDVGHIVNSHHLLCTAERSSYIDGIGSASASLTVCANRIAVTIL